MYFAALATDYDGTIAEAGTVDGTTLEALKLVKASGRKLILATGRNLPDLLAVFPQIDLFDLVVAENGALLFDPATGEETLLAEPPSAAFVTRLQELGVSPLDVGKAIVATLEPNEAAVLTAIRELGLELQIIFNKGAVMVLPSNINKATGLKYALSRLRLSPHNVIGVGDAENDHAFLIACGCGVAVENAIPAVKEKVDWITKTPRGAGVVELAALLIESDLRVPGITAPRVTPSLGTQNDGTPIRLESFETVLIAGSPGAGKSSAATRLIEQMRDLGFQFCIVDPEGDYSEFEGATVIGSAKQEPDLDEVMRILEKPDMSVILNLLAVDAADRPRFFSRLLPEIITLRAATSRPHWVVLGEAHHFLPAKWNLAPVTLPQELPGTIAVTAHPEAVAGNFLDLVSLVIGVGDRSRGMIDNFCASRGCAHADGPEYASADQFLVWRPDKPLQVVNVGKPESKRTRHARKYTEGELGKEKSFFFKGPVGRLNLRAQNLTLFLQIAAGVDDDTWLHHLRAGDYSRWFRDAIKDEKLACEARAVERDASLAASASRARIEEIVQRRYTVPAKAS